MLFVENRAIIGLGPERGLDAVQIELDKGRLVTLPRKGVTSMRITFHIGQYTVTIIVKSRNRHSAK